MSEDRIKQLESELAHYKAREELINKFFNLELYKLGQAFFDKTVQFLSELLGTEYATIGRLQDQGSVKTISAFIDGKLVPNFEYKLEHTPCENVIEGEPCLYESGVAQKFPNDKELAEDGIESYIGVPLYTTEGKTFGLIILLSRKPIPNPKLAESFLLMFAGRASAELEHHDHALQLQQRNKELLIAKQAAEESDQLKTAFLANISHEIRTPLNAILGFASILGDSSNSPAEIEEYDALIKSHGDKLLGLLEGVITLSKIEANILKAEIAPFDPTALLREIDAQYRKHASGKTPPLSFILELDPHLPKQVDGDAECLKRCIGCLLSNALKFTEQGHVTLSAKLQHNNLCISVSDSGPGVLPEHATLIFKRFTQADNTSTRKHGGSGLGLAITKSLIVKMGGEITVETTAQRQTGARFEIRLPL